MASICEETTPTVHSISLTNEWHQTVVETEAWLCKTTQREQKRETTTTNETIRPKWCWTPMSPTHTTASYGCVVLWFSGLHGWSGHVCVMRAECVALAGVASCSAGKIDTNTVCCVVLCVVWCENAADSAEDPFDSSEKGGAI